MVIKNSVISAVRALKKNKVRTVLTSLGVIIGILSVVALYGIGSSAKVSIRKYVFNYGTNGISVMSALTLLTERDIENIQKLIPNIKFMTPLVNADDRMIVMADKHVVSRVYGVGNDYVKMLDWNIDQGSYFSETDFISLERVAIIGMKIKNELFQNRNPLGQTILIEKTPYRVIGYMEERGEALSGRNFDNVALIPFSTAGVRLMGYRGFNGINLSVQSETDIVNTIDLLTKYFKSVHNLEQSDSFEIQTSKDQLRRAESVLKNITILIVITATISLLVGGIGIMNIMLVSVSERTKEIGIRMAVGAKNRDILTQFLIESLMLSSVGGIIGIVLGLIINYIVVSLNEWPFIFSFMSVIISFTFTTTVGILFGFYPAYKASQMNPIEALRHE